MKVVCAYRNPEDGDAALRAIRELVDDDDDEIVAVHIVEPADLPWGLPDVELIERAERDIETLEARMAEGAKAAGLAATVVVEVPNAGEGTAELLAREAQTHDADMIVVVSRRASGVRGLLLGSVAQTLLHLAPCPVLVVRPAGESAARD